jgi:hypothetical protein
VNLRFESTLPDRRIHMPQAFIRNGTMNINSAILIAGQGRYDSVQHQLIIASFTNECDIGTALFSYEEPIRTSLDIGNEEAALALLKVPGTHGLDPVEAHKYRKWRWKPHGL